MSENRRETTFPILRSILHSEALEEALRQSYGLKVSRCELLKPNLSDLYRVDSAAGPYILRVYPHGLNLARWITAEMEILIGLKEAGVPVSTPVRTAGGELLIPLQAPEGERYGVLLTYAHGRSLKRSTDSRQFAAFGKLAASMHKAACALPACAARPALDAYTLLARPLEIINAVYEERSADMDVLREAADGAGAVMEYLGTEGPAWGFCHGDLNFTNVHVTAAGEMTMFNFEYSGPGWPAYDLATVFNFEATDPAKAFLEGYESERPLHPRERAALGWFQAANKIWILGTAASLSSVYGSDLTSGQLFDDTLEFVQQKLTALGR